MLKHTEETETNTVMDHTTNNYLSSDYRKIVGNNIVYLPKYYPQYEEILNNFPVKDDDIFIATFPKTGSTWCQEMVWLIANNLDYEGAKVNIQQRFPLFEGPMYFHPNPKERVFQHHPLIYPEKHPGPRYFKTHMFWRLLPEAIRNGTKKPKIINILRNPHDTCVSYYHFYNTLGRKMAIEEFCELFLSGEVISGPFWLSVLDMWNERHRSNVLLLKFSEMKSDLPSVIRKVADFLEKPINDEQIKQLAEHLSFQSIKNNPAVNFIPNFARRGEVGGYKTEMSPEFIQKFDEWGKEHFQGTNIPFD